MVIIPGLLWMMDHDHIQCPLTIVPWSMVIPGPFRTMDQACIQCPLTIMPWSMVILVPFLVHSGLWTKPVFNVPWPSWHGPWWSWYIPCLLQVMVHDHLKWSLAILEWSMVIKLVCPWSLLDYGPWPCSMSLNHCPMVHGDLVTWSVLDHGSEALIYLWKLIMPVACKWNILTRGCWGQCEQIPLESWNCNIF